ncbi:hypothetical protein [Verrucomicrobium sp. BvORR034]|uniref:hypothetical protein n=1 Tax=Verrucomicrobium sp. BvORR034 TaxID=1396418 RepID=UPI0006795205|nr:hypothetical protein [Verrucomicrobium sp. BvORR034]
MNKITIFTLIPADTTDRNRYTASSVRLNASTMNHSNLDLNSGNTLPHGRYKIPELGIEIQVVSNDDNRYQFWTL